MYEIDIKVIRLNNTNMPKTPTDFSKALIYSIVCKTDETLLYIGSTTNFKIRKNAHKNACNNENDGNHNLPVYVMMRANGGWDSFKMTPVKEYPCDNKIQLVIEEERIRVEIKAKLNTIRAYRSPEERKEDMKKYYEANAEYFKTYKKDNAKKIADRAKQYYESHKEHATERKKQYYQANKQQIIDRAKQNYEKNKEQTIDRAKQYYQANKQQILERMKIKKQELKNAL